MVRSVMVSVFSVSNQGCLGEESCEVITSSSRSLMSFEDDPIITRNTPGSTTHFMSRSSNRSSFVPSAKVTHRHSPGSTCTRVNPFKARTGCATDASTSRT